MDMLRVFVIEIMRYFHKSYDYLLKLFRQESRQAQNRDPCGLIKKGFAVAAIVVCFTTQKISFYEPA